MKFLKSFAIQLALAALAAFVFVYSSRSLPERTADTLRVTTWNLQWFPNGSPKRASSAEQAERIEAAAKVLKALDSDVLLLQEIWDRAACDRLVEAMAPAKYEVLVCSQFREGNGIGRQQTAILAKTSADGAWAETWKTKGLIDPPRGYSFAVIPFGKRQIGFYSVHLKSNLVRKDADQENQLNILKRETAAEQLIEHSRAMSKDYPRMNAVVVGGDFNTNRDQDLFAKEKTIELFEKAGFSNPYSKIPLADRVTHPGNGKYPDATFDYLFFKGLKTSAAPHITKTSASDHHPVTIDFPLKAKPEQK